MPELPVAATAQGSLDVATVGWRLRGRLYVTVVAKATFSLVPEGRMTPTEPTRIVDREALEPSGSGILLASDLAPFLGQAEIVVTGRVQVPPSFAGPSLHVQLAVVQQGALCVDKQVGVPIRAGGGSLPIGGMGAISSAWPLRARWLNGIDARILDKALAEIPEGVHWEYFQTSPQDQRLPRIVGDEWIVLGGMVAGRPRFRTQLPEARAVARLYRAAQPVPRDGEPIALHADTLQVDVDRLRCSILWRGRVELSSAEELDALHVAVALEQPGKPALWEDPIELSIDALEEVDDGIMIGSTVGISPDVAKRLAAAAALPFQKAPPVAATSKPIADVPIGVTLTLEDDVRLLLGASAATPFKPRSPSPPRAANRVCDPLSTTFDVSTDLRKLLAERGATPFEASAPKASAPTPDPLNATFELPTNLARLLANQAATPFDANPDRTPANTNIGATLLVDPEDARRLAKSAVPFNERAGPTPSFEPRQEPAALPLRDPLNATSELSTDIVRALAGRAATPFSPHPVATGGPIAAAPPRVTNMASLVEAARPPDAGDFRVVRTEATPLPSEDDEEDSPLGELGNEFLAALARAG